MSLNYSLRSTRFIGVRIDFNDPAKFGRDSPVASPGGGSGKATSDHTADGDRNGAARHSNDTR